MKHIQAYDDLNEGIIQKIKDFIFQPVHRVSFKVTHKRGKGPKKEEDKKKFGKDKDSNKLSADHFKPQHKYFDVKSKDEGEAEDKFYAAIEKELKGLEPKPEIEIISIHKVKKLEHKTIKLF